MPTSAEQIDAKERQVQELIVSCMTDQGFEYLPFVGTVITADSVDGDPNDRAWAEKYGYGISNFPMSQPDQSGPVDPNQTIVDAMSESEREAYYVALHGAAMAAEVPSDISTAQATEASPIPPGDQGCWSASQATVYGGQGMTGNGDEFQDMWDSYSAVFEQLNSDPRVVQAQGVWSTCLADAGHAGFSKPDDTFTQISEKWSELNGWPSPTADAMPQVSASPPPTPSADAVTAFQNEEIALAVADFDCRQSSGPRQTTDEVRVALEQQFLDANKTELERYRDVINGGGG